MPRDGTSVAVLNTVKPSPTFARASEGALGSQRRNWLLWCGLTIGLLAAVGWLAAPRLIARKVRKQLAALPGGYAGDIEGVEVRLFAGEVALLGMRIEKTRPRIPAAFLRADEFVLGFVHEG